MQISIVPVVGIMRFVFRVNILDWRFISIEDIIVILSPSLNALIMSTSFFILWPYCSVIFISWFFAENLFHHSFIFRVLRYCYFFIKSKILRIFLLCGGRFYLTWLLKIVFELISLFSLVFFLNKIVIITIFMAFIARI